MPAKIVTKSIKPRAAKVHSTAWHTVKTPSGSTNVERVNARGSLVECFTFNFDEDGHAPRLARLLNKLDAKIAKATKS